MNNANCLIKGVILGIMSLCCFNSSYGAGVVVVAGGGEEGKAGDQNAWSYGLYKRLIDNGDINGDKKIKVVVLSYYAQEDSWYKDYFKSLGASSVEAVVATNKKDANNPKVADQLKDADVIFFRGGDQTEYYHNWKGTLLEKRIKELDKSGGAIGGTSAGAMSLAGYALAGGQELGSKDVLKDAKTKLLNDKKGGTSIHNDFLNIVPNAIIETHYGERARLGRALGVHAKASEDYRKNNLLMIAVSEQTGIAISKNKAQVYGNGTVEFIQQTPETKNIRENGAPLVYTNLRNDVLTDGWVFDMKNKTPDLLKTPIETQELNLKKKCGTTNGDFSIDGSKKEDSSLFEFAPKYGADNYELSQSDKKSVKLSGVIGVTRANSYQDDPPDGAIRAKIQASLYRAMYDAPNRSAILLSEESLLKSSAQNKDLIEFANKAMTKEKESSSIVLDCSSCTHKSLSPRVSELDNGSKTLRLPALINLRMHVLGASKKFNLAYNLKSRQVQSITEATDSLGCDFNATLDIKKIKQSVEDLLEKISDCEP